MSNDSWGDAQGQGPVKKKGMSGCMLAGLIVGGIGLVGVLGCCGVSVWFGSMMVPVETRNPAEVEAVGRKVLDTQVVDTFAPDHAITMDNMFFTMRIAEYKHKAGKGEMMIGVVNVKIGDPSQGAQQSHAFRDPLEQKMRANLQINKTESQEITINGQKVQVSIGEGTDQVTNAAVHTLGADWKQSSGQAFIFLRVDDDAWDQDALLKMLEDAKLP